MTNMQHLRWTIIKYMDAMQMTKEETALALGMSKGTFRNRLASPETFTVSELVTAIKRLQIPPDELLVHIAPDGRQMRRSS